MSDIIKSKTKDNYDVYLNDFHFKRGIIITEKTQKERVIQRHIKYAEKRMWEIWGKASNRSAYVVPPTIKFSDAKTGPRHLCFAWLSSYKGVPGKGSDDDPHGSQLFLIFWTTIGNGTVISEIIDEFVKDIKWKQHAKNWWM